MRRILAMLCLITLVYVQPSFGEEDVTAGTLTPQLVQYSFISWVKARSIIGIFGKADEVTVYYEDYQGYWKASICRHLNDGRWLCQAESAKSSLSTVYFFLQKP